MRKQQWLDTEADLEDLRQSAYALRLLTDALAIRTANTDLAPLVERIQSAVLRITALLDRLHPPSLSDNT